MCCLGVVCRFMRKQYIWFAYAATTPLEYTLENGEPRKLTMVRCGSEADGKRFPCTHIYMQRTSIRMPVLTSLHESHLFLVHKLKNPVGYIPTTWHFCATTARYTYAICVYRCYTEGVRRWKELFHSLYTQICTQPAVFAYSNSANLNLKADFIRKFMDNILLRCRFILYNWCVCICLCLRIFLYLGNNLS